MAHKQLFLQREMRHKKFGRGKTKDLRPIFRCLFVIRSSCKASAKTYHEAMGFPLSEDLDDPAHWSSTVTPAVVLLSSFCPSDQ
jgi:hypothetical protein